MKWKFCKFQNVLKIQKPFNLLQNIQRVGKINLSAKMWKYLIHENYSTSNANLSKGTSCGFYPYPLIFMSHFRSMTYIFSQFPAQFHPDLLHPHSISHILTLISCTPHILTQFFKSSPWLPTSPHSYPDYPHSHHSHPDFPYWPYSQPDCPHSLHSHYDSHIPTPISHIAFITRILPSFRSLTPHSNFYR